LGAFGEAGEVGFAAFDFRAIAVAQVVGEEAAFGLDHEKEALGVGVLDKECPLRRVGAEPGGDFEPAREFDVNFDRLVLFQGFVLQVGENVGQFDVALVEGDRGRNGSLCGLDAGAADGDIGFAPLQPDKMFLPSSRPSPRLRARNFHPWAQPTLLVIL
jgi:hypothetical protein